jgi:hypothetical protein
MIWLAWLWLILIVLGGVASVVAIFNPGRSWSEATKAAFRTAGRLLLLMVVCAAVVAVLLAVSAVTMWAVETVTR